jgi:hypothetical protein
MNFCGTCHHHFFPPMSIDNACRVHKDAQGKPVIIPRAKWGLKKEDGSMVCSCGKWVDWMSHDKKEEK